MNCLWRILHRHDNINYAKCTLERGDGNGDTPDRYLADCDQEYWEDGAPKYCRHRLQQSPGVAR